MQTLMDLPSAPALHSIAEAILVIAVGVKAWVDQRSKYGRARELDALLTEKLAPVHQQLLNLTAYVIGPDGENGIRGDVREMKEQIRGLEDRERQRLEPRDIGALRRP